MSHYVIGIHGVQGILKEKPHTILKLLIQRGKEDKAVKKILDLAATWGIASEVVKKDVLDHLQLGNHQGIVAEIKEPDLFDETILPELIDKSESPLFLVLDGVQDPHNLGACLRTADAAAVTGVIIPKHGSCGLTSVVQKVACGAAATVPVIRVTNLVRTIKELQQLGIWFYGLSANTEQSLFQAKFAGPLGIVMGAEGSGLKRLTEETCDYLLKIPMHGQCESLNVSVATGIALYEVVRQRTQ